MTTAPDSTGIRKIVRITAKAGLGPQARQALHDLERATRSEPGCRSFGFFQALDSETSFVLFEDFADAAALEAHMQLPHTRDFFALGLLDRIEPVPRDWIS